jgi:hypothetical protein
LLALRVQVKICVASHIIASLHMKCEGSYMMLEV